MRNTDHVVVADYIWYDENSSDEVAMGYDDEWPQNLAKYVGSNSDFLPDGIHVSELDRR